MQINQSNVLITGASSGIGLSLAQQFLNKGAKVCAFSRRGMPSALRVQYPHTLLDMRGDISNVKDVLACMDMCAKEFGDLQDL